MVKVPTIIVMTLLYHYFESLYKTQYIILFLYNMFCLQSLLKWLHKSL